MGGGRHLCPPELVLWARYIDDVLLLWDGSYDSLCSFMDGLNSNERGISFKYEASQEKIHFLDLEIRGENNSLLTSTYFKVTDRNSFIPRDSCHHKAWLDSVPKSQYIRLKRNCSTNTDFLAQSKVLTDRFIEKGYEAQFLTEKLNQVVSLDRDALLADKTRAQRDCQLVCPLIRRYSCQHFSVRRMLNKHWHIIKNDPVLGPSLPDRPQLVFRGAPSISSRVVSAACDPPVHKPMFFQHMTGYFKCKNCEVCAINALTERKVCQFITNNSPLNFHIKSFITCSTTHVVYLLTCPCGLHYVGRTVRSLKVRLGEHIGNIRRGFLGHPVSKHYLDKHKKDPSGTLFMGIDKLKLPWRGGSKRRAISKLEMEWIYKIRSLRPLGLNVDIELNAFIDNS